MALFILQRLASYLRPLLFLAVGLYGMHSQSGIPSKHSPPTTGAFLVFLETVTFRSRPKDVLNPSKLKDRIFGKLWLRIGMAWSLHAIVLNVVSKWNS